MAVNLINSSDIEVIQSGDNIQLNTTVDMQTVEANVETNTTDITNLKNGEVYSTTEVKTNKVWIDNKPIYRITYRVQNLSSGNNYFGSTTGIDEYINGYGILHRSNGNHYFISSYQTSTAFVSLGMDNNTYNKFNLVLGSGISNVTDAYVTIEYTKTS